MEAKEGKEGEEKNKKKSTQRRIIHVISGHLKRTQEKESKKVKKEKEIRRTCGTLFVILTAYLTAFCLSQVLVHSALFPVGHGRPLWTLWRNLKGINSWWISPA
ncbi:hypothetical protein [Marinobacter oulmenensis]|uniref:hypothetical protein n=1 Tax=Marinobacter oulmenensis TaxID=643747 RepID=UPI003613C4BA